MTIAVVGDSAAALATAALAGLSSGEPILLAGWVPGSAPALTSATQAGVKGRLMVADGSAVQADAYVVVADAATLPGVLRTHAARLAGRPVLLAPGNCGGALMASAQFAETAAKPPRFCEAPGFPAIGRVNGSHVDVLAVKRRLPFASLDEGRGERDLDLFRRYLPDLVMSDLWTTSLSNTNHLIHPPLVIANAKQIRVGTAFRFYREGELTVGAGIMGNVDEDRMRLLDGLGLPKVRLVDWMSRYYSDQGLIGNSIEIQLRTFAPFEGSPAPTTFQHRYLLDDVRFGLAPIEAIAGRIGVAVPDLSTVVSAASELAGEDLRTFAEERATALMTHFRPGGRLG